MWFNGNGILAQANYGSPDFHIDMHTHILPCFGDDGPKTREETLEMAHQIKEKGADAIVWTPHYGFPKLRHITYDRMMAHHDEYAPWIEAQTGLKVLLGSELYLTPQLPEKMIPLGNSDFVLFETSLDTYPQFLFDMIYQIQIRGYRLILAHVERYRWLVPKKRGLLGKKRNDSLLKALAERNVFFQVNYSTLFDLDGFPWVRDLIEQESTIFLGSDKHIASDGRELVDFPRIMDNPSPIGGEKVWSSIQKDYQKKIVES